MLQSFEIEVPPLDVQRQIAALGAAADDSRASAAQHLAAARTTVERFRQAVLAAACSGRLTADWLDELGFGEWNAAPAVLRGAHAALRRRWLPVKT